MSEKGRCCSSFKVDNTLLNFQWFGVFSIAMQEVFRGGGLKRGLQLCCGVCAYFISQLQSKLLTDAKAAVACNFQLRTEWQASELILHYNIAKVALPQGTKATER